MKKLIHTASLGLLVGNQLLAASDQDFIRQNNLGTGVISDIYVSGPDGIGEESGSSKSSLAVDQNGLRYELYGMGKNSDGEVAPILLDETVTGAIPEGYCTLTSKDTADVAVMRTRADQPFEAQFTLKNINTKSDDVSVATKYLYIEHLVSELPDSEDEISIYNPENEELRVVMYSMNDDNGSYPSSGPLSLYTSLQNTSDAPDSSLRAGEKVQKQKGIERFRVYALGGDDLAWYIQNEQIIHVWPEAHADEITFSVSGNADDATAVDGETLSSSLPTFHINVHDIYPESSTWVRIYPGEQKTSIDSDSDLFVSLVANYSPSDSVEITPISVTDFQLPSNLTKEMFAEPGTFTIEVLTQTTFTENPECLKSATFTIPDNTITVNGKVTTSE